MDSRLRTLILAIAVFFLTPTASLQADETNEHSIVGSFEGIVWSTDTLWPITTIFAIDASSELTGSYVYEEAGGTFEETLSRFRKTDQRTWLPIWVEHSGSGTMEAVFNEDFSRFVGLWSPLDDGDAGYPWVGERKD